jgi:hypothetical protein
VYIRKRRSSDKFTPKTTPEVSHQMPEPETNLDISPISQEIRSPTQQSKSEEISIDETIKHSDVNGRLQTLDSHFVQVICEGIHVIKWKNGMSKRKLLRISGKGELQLLSDNSKGAYLMSSTKSYGHILSVVTIFETENAKADEPSFIIETKSMVLNLSLDTSEREENSSSIVKKLKMLIKELRNDGKFIEKIRNKD